MYINNFKWFINKLPTNSHVNYVTKFWQKTANAGKNNAVIRPMSYYW